MWFVFALLGLAIASGVAADQVHNIGALWIAASVGWLAIMWVAIAKA